MNLALNKTNSWHWLGCAVACSTLASYFVWGQVTQYIAQKHEPVKKRQAAHMEELLMLTEEQADALNRQIDAVNKQVSQLQADIQASGVQPIPVGTESLLAVKNTIDSALAENRLRVISSDIRVPVAAVAAAPAPAAKPSARGAAPEEAQVSAMSREEAINAIKDPKIREMALAEERRKNKSAKPAAAPAQAKARPTPAARSAPSAPAAAAPAESLPFKTQDMNYTVEGDYKNMFLFLVRQSFKKPSYHFKNITLGHAPTDGMRMTFVVQINYQEK